MIHHWRIRYKRGVAGLGTEDHDQTTHQARFCRSYRQCSCQHQSSMFRTCIQRRKQYADMSSFRSGRLISNYPDSDAPHHVLAMSVNASGAFLAICTALVLRFILLRYNKQLASGQKTVAQVMKGEAGKAIAGVTSEENERRKEAFRFDA